MPSPADLEIGDTAGLETCATTRTPMVCQRHNPGIKNETLPRVACLRHFQFLTHMNLGQWRWLKRLPAMLAVPRPEPAEYARRIVALQRNIILPARLLVVVAVFYYV